MATPASLESPPAPPRRRWRQFSLLWLLALVVAGCLVAAWYGERRRREAAEELVRQKETEIRDLRVQLGILDDSPPVLNTSDKHQIHVRLLPPRNEMEWRWRIFVPPGKSWNIQTSFGEQWIEERYWGSEPGTSLKFDGEFTLVARICRELDGQALLEVQQGSSTLRSRFPDEGLAVLRGYGTSTGMVAGAAKQESFDAGGEITLLRWQREGTDQQASVIGRPPLARFGLSIHLAEEQDALLIRKRLSQRASSGSKAAAQSP
jgi:hypothetical protein